jgi:hypothetical protein
LRVAAANGYPSPGWLGRIQEPLRSAKASEQTISAMATLVGRSNQALAQLASPFGSGTPIPERYIAARPRVCPECIAETGRVDGVFELAMSCACPKHGIRLADTCPNCRKNLTWHRWSLVHCRCGHPLNEFPRIKVEETLRYLNALIWAAASRPDHRCAPAGFPAEALEVMPLASLCNLIQFVGTHLADDVGRQSMRTSMPQTVAQAESLQAATVAVLAEWPTRFELQLERLQSLRGYAPGQGLQQAYGTFYTYLYDAMADRGFDFLKQAFESYLSRTWPGLIDDKYRRLRNVGPIEGIYVSTNEAARTLGVGRREVVAMVTDGSLRGESSRQPSGRQLTLIARESLEGASHVPEQLVDRRTAGQLMGLVKRRFPELVQAGLVAPVSSDAGTTKRRAMFRQTDLEAVIQAFERLPRKTSQPSAKTIPLVGALRTHLFGKGILGDFLKCVLAEGVSVASWTEGSKPSLRSLNFCLAEVEQFCVAWQSDRYQGLTIPEVAERLAIKQQVAYHLVNSGKLVADAQSAVQFLSATGAKESIGRLGKRISESRLQEFNREYVALARLAASFGCRSRAALVRLAALGCQPAIGPGVDGCRQIFFRCADLAKAEIAPSSLLSISEKGKV